MPQSSKILPNCKETHDNNWQSSSFLPNLVTLIVRISKNQNHIILLQKCLKMKIKKSVFLGYLSSEKKTTTTEQMKKETEEVTSRSLENETFKEDAIKVFEILWLREKIWQKYFWWGCQRCLISHIYSVLIVQVLWYTVCSFTNCASVMAYGLQFY